MHIILNILGIVFGFAIISCGGFIGGLADKVDEITLRNGWRNESLYLAMILPFGVCVFVSVFIGLGFILVCLFNLFT